MEKTFEVLIRAMDQYGPTLVFVAVLLLVNGFFIWRDWKREDRQQKQIDSLHASHNDIVLPLLTECKEVIATCKEAIVQNSQVIAGFINGSRK